ncbi:iron-containing alcohol dehydrogenase [Sinanaerobacter chloroacetimidivorans]|uniref:Iron-containing alcohol dehydrogenase n=1 Tax=Sinanaerobacter chloroacetimidivorans TaxID=2818044 RepID=A0A8J7VZC8_9FIRM|nr:iron-containing alcohol dehydrogenase [Sinanaerobacter chloroacetimidivorans]MBR0597899.1 iron-containing alcohol dehydrogenase [Sinanaerobacter chloroacetimidivorans]
MTLLKYSFSLPTRVEFGEGVIKQAGKEAKSLGATKIMLIADKGVISAGLTQAVEESLREENLSYITYDKIVPNPRDIHCIEGYELAKKEGIDFLVAVGGGSSMDTAKAIGTLLTHGKTIRDWCGFQLLEREITPLIAIPTTAGTGSEVTPFAVITDTNTHVKLNIFDPKAAAKVALVDPGVLMKLPSGIMASTGIDAMTHAVEAYTCNLATPHTDAYALYAIDLIVRNLRQAVKMPTIESCTGMMLGSTIAGIAFGYSDVAAVHCMAEALGGRYDTPHGVANAVLLPTVTEYNIPANVQKHANVAKALGVDMTDITLEEAALRGVETLRELCRDVGIKKMREIDGIDPKDFPALAEAAEKNVSTPSNPRKITAKEYLELFHKAYEV